MHLLGSRTQRVARNVTLTDHDWAVFDELRRREDLLRTASKERGATTYAVLMRALLHALEREQDRRAKRLGVDLTPPPRVYVPVDKPVAPPDPPAFRAPPRPQSF